MNYPVWEVPYIGIPWVIGIMAIFHIMIAHFAVGGGIYLAVAERKALKENRREWLPLIAQHSKFFLILTAVFGTVSGVGIWFSIGLIQPEATSTLIHNFVFGWAIEWVFFMVELTAAAVYYYSWTRVPDQLHAKVGIVYAVASVCTMIIINGILTFMLDPGKAWLSVAGTGNEAAYFWPAFFNPTYWPSLVLRLLSALSLAGIWALVSFSKLDDEKFGHGKVQMIRWSASWLAPAFLLMPFAFLWYVGMVPGQQRHLLEMGMTTIGSGAFTQVTRIGLISVITTATIAGVVYFFAYRFPRDFTFGHAVSVLCLALAATGSTEFAREAIRKPYVIGGHMYSNSVRVREVQKFNSEGYLTHSMWAPEGVGASQIEIGRDMFRGQCMSCHTLDGYRSMRGFLATRDDKALDNMVKMLRSQSKDAPYHNFMPPLVGTDAEVAALEEYLRMVRGPGPAPSPAAPTAPSGSPPVALK